MNKYYNNGNIQYILHFPGTEKFGEDICNNEINRKIKVSDKITLISPMNKPVVEKSYLKKQCDFNNIDLVIPELAYNTVDWNHCNKILMILEALEKATTEYCVVLDGSDTIIVNDLDDEFINKCLSYNSNILYNADIKRFPKNYNEKLSPEVSHSYTKFMNAGICFGKTSELLKMFNEIKPLVKWFLKNPGGDQLLIKMYRNDIDENAYEVDYDCKLFTVIHSENKSTASQKIIVNYSVDGENINISEEPNNIKWYNKDGDRLYILHFPGDGMANFGERFVRWEANRNFKISKDLSIISIMTKDYWEDSPLRKQCDLNGVNIYNSALEAANWNNTMKIDFILECLDQVATPYVIICDGRDVVICNDLDDKFIETYKKQAFPVMYNSTIFRYPDIAVENMFDMLSQPGEFKYFNAGVCIGDVKHLKAFYRLCKKYNKQLTNNTSEQLVLRTARAYGDKYKTIGIDSYSQLFRTLHTKDNDLFYDDAKSKVVLVKRNIENSNNTEAVRAAKQIIGPTFNREFCDERGVWRNAKYLPEEEATQV